MTVPQRRRLLPLFTKDVRHANRSSMTCRFRCGNACDHPVPNESGNEYFGDIVNEAVASRRGVLRAGAVGAIAIGAGVAGVAGATPAMAAEGAEGAEPLLAQGASWGKHDGTLSFRAIPPNTLDKVIVPNGYDSAVVIEWGDKVTADAPDFDIDDQSAWAQRRQFGYNNDFVGVLPYGRDRDKAILVANHEYTN
ncbi:MAG TPA: alkaline phosphatase PhoX, partial [Phytomonospora sp.]